MGIFGYGEADGCVVNEIGGCFVIKDKQKVYFFVFYQ